MNHSFLSVFSESGQNYIFLPEDITLYKFCCCYKEEIDN